MATNQFIQVFEHSCLSVDGTNFKESHFKQLVRYNETHGNKYFSIGLQRIYFRSWVGVIQVGNLTIEILPKADKSASVSGDQKSKWHGVLLDMLRYARYFKLESLTEAHLDLRNCSLLDLYFLNFIEEIEYLVHCGLIKKYRKEQKQVKSLKGKLLIHQQITRNATHKERFFTEHVNYDRNHLLNRILRRALEILSQIGGKDMIVVRTRKLLLDFDNIDTVYPVHEDFERIRLDRKTEPYRKALLLAKMIILNYSPDFKGGHDNVLALLFDMNRLFEDYVFKALSQAARERRDMKVTLDPQQPRDFWGTKTIRPDIVVNVERDARKPEKIIIDSKWKVPDDHAPNDADLKQMFAYNMHFGSQRSILLYPEVHFKTSDQVEFKKSDAVSDFTHTCQMVFAPIVSEDGTLNREFGVQFFDNLYINQL